MGQALGRHSVAKLTVKQIDTLKPGKYADGNRLFLRKRSVIGGSWLYLFSMNGKRFEMALGKYPDVSLSAARLKASQNAVAIGRGENPMTTAKAEREAQQIADAATVRAVAEAFFEKKRAGLKNEGKSGRWFSPIEIHVLPGYGDKPIADLTVGDVSSILEPIWETKAVTARKVATRLNKIMEYAATAKRLPVDRNAVTDAVAGQSEIKIKPTNIPAMSWQDVPDFYGTLDDAHTAHRALKLLILTGCRSTPIRFAHVDQINGDVWTVPAERMKTDSAFRVPLPKVVRDHIAVCLNHARDGFLFPGVRKGVISDMSMAKILKDRDLSARPHGFRSSLREWCQVQGKLSKADEELSVDAKDTKRAKLRPLIIQWYLSEAILAHKFKGKIEGAYQRDDLLDERFDPMTRWAAFVTGASDV